MRMRGLSKCVLLACGVLANTASYATSISYDLTKLAGNTWQYDFTVANNSLGVPIGEFTLFFDYHTFSNLTDVSEPLEYAGPAVVQPVLPINPLFPIAQDGFFDYLAADAGLAPHGTLGGFIVDVSFTGPGTPGGPQFQVVDANFNTIDSGSTTPSQSVPEPTTLGLLAIGLLAALMARRRPASDI
jgi:hypothetical protein